ncbi:acyltransferase-domain-containing protein [Mytilinidion resinicola]|uniref:Acyltransferase-domain-containing protein n=1 Tax=Mytilinidion resinicola TaxID=574789 RepID=A0A6A6YJ51_9PEZI|nr:acyltransferase-domain-containing protein [Mytilinidion resinicola]KAF2808014.1 acyltransferase-domain-containing protein [Mytilinidion resinicola]
MAPKPKKTDLGAGLNVAKKTVENHPAGPPKHGELSQAERAFTLASTFMSGVLAISASQFLGAPLKLIDPAFYDGYMAYTKESFAILITCLTQWWAPTVVRVSGDESMAGQLSQMKDGSLKCNFSDRMVMMANHQLYTDWLYLWWIAYTNGMHGYIYIILKESLKNIPILGWGAQFYNFIFLSRKWEDDKHQFKQHLATLNKPKDPMWLLIFPEGTNLSQSTREASKRWADKNGLQDMKHQLLPRSTGLRFCLQELRETSHWLYDCTIAYEGVPPGQFGQDIFTLRSSFFEGRPPKSVNMHWRRFHVDSIPIDNPKAFDVWLRNRWREKDYLLEYFTRHSKFPADDYWKDQLDVSDTSSGSHSIRNVAPAARMIETEVKSGSWNEFVKIFAPITSVMMALTLAYGASPADLPIPGGTEFLTQQMGALLGAGDAAMKGPPNPEQMEKLIEGAAKMSAAQTVEPKNQDKVQRLTQEHLAQLVKESAIKNGMVLPNGLPTVGQKRKAVSTVGPPRRTPIGTQKYPPKAQSVANLRSTRGPSTATKQPALPLKAKPAPSGPMTTVMTKSGVPIQVAKSEVEKVKGGGVVMTKSGIPIHISKGEAEKAQSGRTFTTASGVTIQVSPSIGNPVKRESKPAASGSGPKSLGKVGPQASQKPAVKPTTKPTIPKTIQQKPKANQGLAVQNPPVRKPVTAPKTAAKPAGSQLNGATPKKQPASTGPPKIQAPKTTPKKLAT